MFSFSSTRLRLVYPLLAAGLLATGATPVLAQPVTTARCDAPVLDLANPSPGDMLMPGAYQIQGVAFDPRAQQDTGIDHVAVFLDSRDAGGIDLGNTTPHFTAPALNLAPDEASFSTADSFNMIVTLPNVVGAHTLVAYAHSSVTGQETTVSVPIALGEDPVKAGLQAGASSEANTNPGTAPSNCASATAATTSTQPPMAAAPQPTPMPQPATTTTTTPSAHPITLELSNPQPGDTVVSGAYTVAGSAVDTRAQFGSGIDRVSIFLDSRDDGGMQLAQVVPVGNTFSVTVQLPTNRLGGHTIVAYAHSAISDTEAMVSAAITVDH